MSYKSFFYESRRATSLTGKKVMVVKEDLISEFLEKVAGDTGIEERIRLLVGVMFTGGLRVSEALSIKKEDIEIRGGVYILKVKVLKKKLKYTLTRDVVIHPSLINLLLKIMSSKRPQERLFDVRANAKARIKGEKMTRQKALYALKSALGIDCHSLRHSNVSFLMSRGLSDVQIAKVLEMSVKNVANYTHLNQVRMMAGLYGV